MDDTPPPSQLPRVLTADDPLPPVNELVVLAGGAEETVLRRDGERATVKVQLVGLDRMLGFAQAAVSDDELGVIDFACGKDPGWAATLTLPSQERLAMVVEHLNGDAFSRWADRRTRRLKASDPLVRKGLELASALPPSALQGLLTTGPRT